MIVAQKAYTTKELVLLLSIVKKSALARAKRENWQSRPREGRGGGYEWLVDSMPETTQLAIRTAIERNALSEATHALSLHDIDKRFTTQSTANVMIDDKKRLKALAKADLLSQYLNWQKKYGFTVQQKQEFIDAYNNGTWSELLDNLGRVSFKTLERWKLKQKEADGVLSLVDTRGVVRTGLTSITERHKYIILGQVLNPNAASVSACYRKVKSRCKAEELHIPSERTVRRFVTAYMNESYDEWVMFREGKKAWNDKCAISILRDWNLVDVGDVVIADGHVLNFETINPDTGKPKRMTLLLFFDGASNHPLGWEVMASENIDCISSAFRRTCMTLGKIPKVIYLDNGKAFRAKYFKGTKDFQQAGFLGLYRDLGCEVIHAWAYHGQSKPIERFFGTFHELEVFIPSYVGNSIARKPARTRRNEKLHQELYKKMGGRALTLTETHQAIAEWFSEYVNRPQYRTHLQGKSPSEVFQKGRGDGVDENKLAIMMMRKQIKTITKDGIRHMGQLFWHPALASRRHSVLIRYDEQFYPHSVFVYSPEGKFICEAKDRHHYKIASGLHPAARVLGTEEQQQDLLNAINLKKLQEKESSKGIREMLRDVVLPEAEVRQNKYLTDQDKPRLKGVSTKTKTLSHEEIKKIEKAKEEARADFNTNNNKKYEYEASYLKRFRDELDRYEYLFVTYYEMEIPLVPQDKAWMETFERTTTYNRSCKERYETRIELMQYRKQAS